MKVEHLTERQFDLAVHAMMLALTLGLNARKRATLVGIAAQYGKSYQGVGRAAFEAMSQLTLRQIADRYPGVIRLELYRSVEKENPEGGTLQEIWDRQRAKRQQTVV